MKYIALILAIIVSSFMVGCSEKETDGKNGTAAVADRKPGAKAGFGDLSDDAILISVNDRKLTKADFLKWVELRLCMAKMTQSQPLDDGLKSLIRDQMLASVTNEFARQVVAAGYAKDTGLETGTGMVARCRTGFSHACRMPNTKWDSLIKKFPRNLRGTIEERVASEALLATVFAHFVEKNNVGVGPEEIDKLYSDYLDYNRKCSMTNSIIWGKASNIWQRVETGENFKELAAQFDEDEYREANGVWGTFHASDFTDEPEIWKLIPKFRPGWISPPIEADNGVMVMKIDSIEDSNGDVASSSYVPSPSAEFTISRIFLHLPLFMEKTEKEQFAQQAIQAKKNVAFQKFLDGLISKSDIMFPNGTEVFGTADSDKQNNGM